MRPPIVLVGPRRDGSHSISLGPRCLHSRLHCTTTAELCSCSALQKCGGGPGRASVMVYGRVRRGAGLSDAAEDRGGGQR